MIVCLIWILMNGYFFLFINVLLICFSVLNFFIIFLKMVVLLFKKFVFLFKVMMNCEFVSFVFGLEVEGVVVMFIVLCLRCFSFGWKKVGKVCFVGFFEMWFYIEEFLLEFLDSGLRGLLVWKEKFFWMEWIGEKL